MIQKNKEYVYHSSKTQNIKKLSPNESTHGESWLYATTTIEMSAVFLSHIGGDLTCQVGRDPKTGKVFICERFKDAFEHRYDNRSGSIYLLPAEKFKAENTGWDEEVTCEDVVEICREIIIDNVKDYLQELIDTDKITLARYPDKIMGLPDDDEDLVYRGIIWTRQFGEKTLKQFKMYHPHLMERINKGLAEGKYLDEHYNYGN